MSSSPLPKTSRPGQHQFLGDLTKVFRRHKISFGHPSDLDHLATDLQTNEAFRSDLFSLCNAISHMSETDLPPEAMLNLVCRALINATRSNTPIQIPEQAKAVFVSTYGQWTDRQTQFGAAEEDDPTPAWQAPPNPFSTAATLSGKSSHLEPASGAGTSSGLRSLAPETPIGSLTLGELKSYLEDIEQRVSRLQPFLDAVAKSAPPASLPMRDRPHAERTALGSLAKTPQISSDLTVDSLDNRFVRPSLVRTSIDSPGQDRPSPEPQEPNDEVLTESAEWRETAPAAPAISDTVAAVAAFHASAASETDAGSARPALNRGATNHVENIEAPVASPAVLANAETSAVPSSTELQTVRSEWAQSSSEPIRSDPTNLARSRPATPIRTRIFARSRIIVPAAATVALTAVAATLVHRRISPPPPAAIATPTTSAGYSDRPSVTPEAEKLSPQILPSQQARVAEAPVKPATPPSNKSLQPSHPLPIAAVASASVFRSISKPGATDSGNSGTAPPAIPAIKQPVPTLPYTRETPQVVSAAQQAPAESTRAIDPTSQRVITQPSSEARPEPSNVAANVRPPLPAATPAPITRKQPEANLIVSVPSPTMMTYAISSPSPQYTSTRRQVDSPVVVQATIGKDGRVLSAHSVSGAADLAAAAVSAMQKWRFRPYLVDGAPVQVVTNIKFVFKAPM